MIASYLRCFTSRLLLFQDVGLLGAHRYTPYIVPPVMGPLGPNCLPTPAVVSSASAGAATAAAAANQLILNQPLVMKNHQQQSSAPNAVVNSTGTAVPVKQQHKTVSSICTTQCACECTSTGRHEYVREYEYERCGQLREVSSVESTKEHNHI